MKTKDFSAFVIVTWRSDGNKRYFCETYGKYALNI